MKHEFRLADIGEGLEEAEIINWLVQVGDTVERDQPLIEVMTDKSNAELPAPTAGIITQLGGAVGDMITVGEVIAVIDSEPTPESVASTPGVAPVPSAATAAVAPVAAAPQPQASTPLADLPTAETSAPVAAAPSARIKASPSTRRAAAERGIDLATVTGSGPGGRILLTDLDSAGAVSAQDPAVSPVPAVQAVAAAVDVQLDAAMSLPKTAPAAGQLAQLTTETAATPPMPPPTPPAPEQPGLQSGVVPLRGVRRAVAKNMAQSWSDIPHIHAFAHIDATALMDLRARVRATGSPAYEHLTPLTFFVAAVARALVAHPHANASLSMADETITHHPQVNVGVAVASPQGLVVPVLQGADRLDFATLSLTLAQLVRGAREGALAREHFLGGTVTITNFGALGGEQAAPLIRPPESMIIGFGSIADRPFVVDGQVVARRTMHTVAGADHRLLDGDTTTSVLNMVNELLSDPLQLVL